MAYYFSGREGDALADAEYHTDRNCEALLAADGGRRPVRDAAVPDDAKWCGECSPHEDLGESDTAEPDTIADAIDAGVCPWCEGYEGDHVGRHASSAHPDAWADYRDDE